MYCVSDRKENPLLPVFAIKIGMMERPAGNAQITSNLYVYFIFYLSMKADRHIQLPWLH